MNVYIRGVPTTYYVDDYIPFYGSSPAFAK